MKGSNLAHGHAWLVGVAGILVGLVLLVYVPSLKAVSGVILLVAGVHLVGGILLLGSIYALAPKWFARVRNRLRHKIADAEAAEFEFGWSPVAMNGLWIAALAVATTAVVVQIAAPAWWLASFALLILAISLFVGNLFLRSSKRLDHVVLPMVDLLSGGRDTVLDAGCGSGRTTLALGRVLKQGRVVALDRFDAGYIEDGGRTLLKRNLRIAGLTDRVRIERGDVTDLPFRDGTFDGAVSAHVIDHLGPQKERGLAEVRRILKPGGRFLLVVWVPGWAMFAVANVLSFFLTSKRQWREMARRVGFEVRDEGVFNGVWFALLEKPCERADRS